MKKSTVYFPKRRNDSLVGSIYSDQYYFLKGNE